MLISAAYLAATVAIGFVVAAVATRQPWPEPVLGDLRHVQWQVMVLALWCAVTTTACRMSRRHPAASQLLQELSPAIDRVLLGMLIVVLVGLGIIGCYPGVMVELGFVAPDSPLAQNPWHAQAYQVESWWALASVTLALAVALAWCITEAGLIAAVALTAVVPLLIAGHWETGHAVASASRWALAIYTLCWTALVTVRRPLANWGQRLFGTDGKQAAVLSNAARDLAMAVGVFSVLGLTGLAVMQSARGATWGGPLADTWFAQLSPTVSYALPLAILIVAMLVLAVREGSAVFAMVGALVMECLVALCVDMNAVAAGAGRSFDWSVAMLQWTAIGWGSYGLVWLSLSRWIERHTSETQRWLKDAPSSDPRDRRCVVVRLGVGNRLPESRGGGCRFRSFGTLAHVCGGRTCGLWHRVARAAGRCRIGSANDRTTGRTRADSGSDGGWCCDAATLAGLPRPDRHVAGDRIGRSGHGSPGEHSSVTTPVGSAPVRIGAAILGPAVFALAVRGCLDDPARPVWTAGMCGGLCVLWAVLGVSGRSQWHAGASVVSYVFAAWTLWWEQASRQGLEFVLSGAYVTVVASVSAALFWFVIEIWYQHKHQVSFDPRLDRPRIHSVIAVMMTALLGFVVVGATTLSVLARLGPSRTSLTVTDAWSIAALLGLGVLLFAMLWDQRAKLSLVALYGWGLIGIALGLNFLERKNAQGAELTVMAACLAGSAYIALTGHLWKWGATWRVGQVDGRSPSQLPSSSIPRVGCRAVNVLGTLLICCLGFVTLFVVHERALRMGVAFAPLLLAYGVGCLAQQRRRFDDAVPGPAHLQPLGRVHRLGRRACDGGARDSRWPMRHVCWCAWPG